MLVTKWRNLILLLSIIHVQLAASADYSNLTKHCDLFDRFDRSLVDTLPGSCSVPQRRNNGEAATYLAKYRNSQVRTYLGAACELAQLKRQLNLSLTGEHFDLQDSERLLELRQQQPDVATTATNNSSGRPRQCPPAYRLTFAADRIPRFLVHVTCFNWNCKPVMRDVRVYQRVACPRGDVAYYRRKWAKIAVDCRARE